MTGLEVLLAVAGLTVTVLVIAGMILITPRNQVDVDADNPDSQGSNLSRASTRAGSGRAAHRHAVSPEDA